MQITKQQCTFTAEVIADRIYSADEVAALVSQKVSSNQEILSVISYQYQKLDDNHYKMVLTCSDSCA